MKRELISVKEAGERYFGVTRTTAYRMAKDGTIPTVDAGRRRRVDVAEMEARLRQNPDQRLLDLVKGNIKVIEIALLLLSNAPDIGDYTDQSRQAIARLANDLGEAARHG